MELSKPKPNSKVGIYVRVSSRGQAQKGQGATVQKETCLSIVNDNNWILYKIYYNPKGVSGDTEAMTREEFREMITDAKNKKFDICLIYSLDRLGRRSGVMESAIDMIFSTGVEFYCLNMKIENSPLGRLFVEILGSFAKYDKTASLLKMKVGLIHARRQRGENQGKVPYGYRREGKKKNIKIIIEEKEAEVIRFIYEERRKDNTFQAIADQLNKLGIAPIRSEAWNHKTVSVILTEKRRRIYCGCFRNGYNLDEVRWPQILPDSFKKPEDKNIEIQERENFVKKYTDEMKTELEQEMKKYEDTTGTKLINNGVNNGINNEDTTPKKSSILLLKNDKPLSEDEKVKGVNISNIVNTTNNTNNTNINNNIINNTINNNTNISNVEKSKSKLVKL